MRRELCERCKAVCGEAAQCRIHQYHVQTFIAIMELQLNVH